MKKILSLCIVLLGALALVACVPSPGPQPEPEADMVTISFNSHGGSAVQSIQVEKGKAFTAPANPIRDGFIFAGWWKEATYVTQWNFATDKPESDLTLHAKWDPAPVDTYDPHEGEEYEINVAINYSTSGQLYSISYQLNSPYNSTLNGQTYVKGDLLPVWEKIEELANVKFVDKAVPSDSNTDAQYQRLLASGFAGVDLVNGTGQNMGPDGAAGSFVNLWNYIDDMPNLKKFLFENPAVAQSIRQGDGGIYFTPYFDGVKELEHMFLARIDWIEDILDAANTNAFDTTPVTLGDKYQKETPNAATYSVVVANPDGTTRTVNKSRTVNIIDVLRGLDTDVNTPGIQTTGKAAADAFRSYINTTYGSNHGYEKLSHIFAGTDASYDADELIALMYVIKANPNYILRQTNGEVTSIELYFPREKSGARVRQMFRGLEMWGLRGVSSRNQWTYIDEDGEIYDIRAGKDVDRFISAVNQLSHLSSDGLIPNVPGFNTSNLRQELLTGATGRFGFLTYDYNASSTTTGLNYAPDGGRGKDPDFKFQAILPPVNNWLGDGEWFHFSESSRSVKNEAWGIPAHVESAPDKLRRVLYIVDEMYNYTAEESIGNVHLYGPVEWRSGEILDYNGQEVYQLHTTKVLGPDGEINTKAAGNHINYLRFYMGATMPIGHIRSLGLEYQTLTQDGRDGIERINTAVLAGTFRIAGLYQSDNPWYRLVPTFLPYTNADNAILNSTTFRTHTGDNNLQALMVNGFYGTNNVISAADYKALLEAEFYDEVLGYQDVMQAAYRRTLGN